MGKHETRLLFLARADWGEQVVTSIRNMGIAASVVVRESIEDLRDAMSRSTFSVLVLDLRMGLTDEELNRFLEQTHSDLPIVAVGSNLTEAATIELVRKGVFDAVDADDISAVKLTLLRAITNRTLLDERVREQAALLDQTNDAIYVCDTDGRVTFWNAGAEKLYGIPASRAMGMQSTHLSVPDEEESMQEASRIAWREGEWIGQLNQVRSNGIHFVVVSRCTTILDAAGQPRSLLVTNTDISEMKAHQEKFIRSQRLESIGTLAGGIAHDLNNVLAPIIMASFLLKTKLEQPELKKLVDTVESSALRGSEIVKQVLTFAKGVDGDHNIIQPKHILRDVAKIVQETFPRNIDFSATIPRNLPTIEGDATQFQQMILNLCVNARDALEEKGNELVMLAEEIELDDGFQRMNVECQKPGAYLLVSIKDNGCGIPSDQLDRVFDPFYTTKKVGQGTGLGLSTALAIARGHNGFINIDSERGQGTTVQVYIPTHVEEGEPSSGESTEERLLGHGELVLVVDDEQAIRDVTRETLTANGYEVVDAANGAEAVAEYAQHKEIAIVITDMLMPVMDGVATISALRKINPGLRIIATSGFAENSKVEAAKQLANAFLPRPYTAKRLLELLREVLRMHDYSGQ